MSEIVQLESIAAADDLLGRAFPLPTRALPLVRWVEVHRLGPDGAEIAWNLDDSREGSPGRVALYAGRSKPPTQLHEAELEVKASNGMVVRRAALEEAEPSLRPVIEVSWRRFGLDLRLTAQGPWDLAEVMGLAESVGG
ncbi:MAG TPA: hypothetical protein VFZ89_18140 [Solirubrobacteraceae bacterium]